MEKAKLFIFLLLALVGAVSGSAAQVTVEVRDSASWEPVPYVAVYVRGTQQGELADDKGRAVLTINTRNAELEISAMGYDKKIVKVDSRMPLVVVELSPTGYKLDEVTVRRGKEHYSKKNNPAVDFMQRIRNADSITNPRRQPYYNYTRYERITLGLNDFEFHPDSLEPGQKKGKFDFLKEHIDTSVITGRPVLPLSVKEKVTDIIYRRDPKDEKQIVRAIRSEGIDEEMNMSSMTVLMEDIFRDIDLYDENVNILQNRFVSPLSRIAPDFYKFYLTDTIPARDGEPTLIELSFAPRNPATFGFTGRLYVAEGDSTMFVRRVRMNVPPSINLNFIERLQIMQEFRQAPNGARLKILDDFNAEISIKRGTQGLYVRRATAYKNHNFEPSPDAEVFDHLGTTFQDPAVYARDEAYWNRERQVAASGNESRISQLMSQLRGVKLYYYAEKFLKIMFTGYVATGNPSKFDIGPVNTFITGNSIEGARMRFGGTTTAALSPHWFAKGYLAYGFKDKKFKYGAELEYSFIPKREHQREFPIHSIAISEKYDMDQLGQHYLFTNPDNVFLAWKRMKNVLMTYRRQTRLDYTLELPNNFSVKASANLERQEATEYVPFTNGFGQTFGHCQEMLFSVELRFAPGEKFFQTKTQRIPVNLDAPVFQLTHIFAPKNLFGAPFTVNKTELSVSKRFWFSAFGFADVIVRGGHVWSKTPYFYLMMPNANLSYTIQPESFALLNPMEFINDSYVSWDLTYWANGAILNYIPLLKKLKLREAFAFRGWLGGLSDKNNPLKTPELYRFPVESAYQPMNGRPYMEISAGIDNLFKVLRVDYVWRLTYRSGMPSSSRSGVRIALHVTF